MCPTLFDFYPDPEDCAKFYRCFWGAGYPFDCPEGTLWNHRVLTCDFAHNVDCEDRYWGEEAHYVEDHKEGHTHDYLYDYGQSSPARDNDADYGGGWDSAGNPRDDSTQWGDFDDWPMEHGESEAMNDELGGSEPADSEAGGDGNRVEYDTHTETPKHGGHRSHGKSESDAHHIHVHNKPRNKTDKSGQQRTTTVSMEDKLLIDHLEKLKASPEKPDRIGSMGSFLEQKTADRSRDANVDYVYANDKDEKAKSHGRYGYYGYSGVQRSGYYAPPSQRLPFFWPFEKRK